MSFEHLGSDCSSVRNECPLQEEAVGSSAGGRGGGGGHTGQVLQSGENQAETAGRGGGAVCGSGEGTSPRGLHGLKTEARTRPVPEIV